MSSRIASALAQTAPATPSGFTPSVTPGSGAFTTVVVTLVTAELFHRLKFCRFKITQTNAGTASGGLTCALPEALAADFDPATNETQSVGQCYYGHGASGTSNIGLLNQTGGSVIATGRTVQGQGLYQF